MVAYCACIVRSNGYDFKQNTVLSRRTFFVGLKASAQARRDHCGARDAVESLKGFYGGYGRAKKNINDSRVSTHRIRWYT